MNYKFLILITLTLSLLSCTGIKTNGIESCPTCISSGLKVLYSEVFGHIHGDMVFYDYDQAICCAKYNNKPVVLIFGGWAASNFKYMYENILSQKHIQAFLNENYIVAYLYVDDGTILPENEWFISPYNDNMIDRLGLKNSILLTKEFKYGSEPYLVILDENEYQVNKGLSFTTDEKKVYDWLAEGLSNAGASVPKIHFNTVLVCNEND